MVNYGSLRSHQERAIAVAREIITGRRTQKVIVAGVTPGGGKTLMASLFGNELADHAVIEQVIVVVPNDSLRKQMRESFHDPARGLERYLRQAGPQAVLPRLGKPFGVVVTYQALSSDVTARRLARMCKGKPTLVIFDEVHHLRANKAWERGAKTIADAARLVLAMSGTLWRWDEERIPFVNYDEKGIAAVDIRYSRATALREQAILPVEFRFFDGNAIYEHRNVPHDSTLSTAPLKEQARALKTALLSSEYTHKFLTAGMLEFEQYRARYYPSQAIGVFHNKKTTRQSAAWARDAFARIAPAVSLCGDGGAADKAIKNFRDGIHPVLFTVRRAYEGLDVRPATHLFYLGDSRSWPFLDQVIARVTRFNKDAPIDWSEQRGYVYVPDDKLIHDYVDNMMDEQDEYFREKEKGPGKAVKPARSTFNPISAEAIDEIGHGVAGRRYTREENIGLAKFAERFPQLRAPLENRLELARLAGLIPLAPGESDDSAA